VHSGAGAGRWDLHPQQPGISKVFSGTVDASAMDFVRLWLYSGVANDAGIELIFDSENEADPAGWDYYDYSIQVDWTGWRYLRIPLADFSAVRNPVGWHHLNYVTFSAGGWGHEPLSDTLLILDDMAFGIGVISDVQRVSGYIGADYVYTYTLTLSERAGVTRTLTPCLDAPPGTPLLLSAADALLTLPPSGTIQTTVHITVPSTEISPTTWLDLHQVILAFDEGGVEVDSVTLEAAVPLPARPRPRLLLDTDDFTRIENWSATQSWAARARDGIIEAADGWAAAFTETYHLDNWALPPEGGQWAGWYVCPTHGVPLRYEGPDRHVCPVDGQVYDGWPYDQVIYTRMHDDLANAARDLALAYRLTGTLSYAEQAAQILLAYADAYSSYPLHDINGGDAQSGARVHAQTLGEAIWLVPMAWAYDLIADTPALTATQRAHIEQDLLQAAVATIERNPMGTSNWQSWHNAGVGAVGFALEDPVLASRAIRDPDHGFDYQMEASVDADGFWYEGSWSYHFFALTAHRYLAEMAARAGLDLYAGPSLRAMFEVPLGFAMPDWTLPPFNDSGNVSLIDQGGLYESAYRRYGDARFTAVLDPYARGRDALFWGVEALPDPARLDLQSALFPAAGYAVLRGQGTAGPVYVALDYGPHGGWHGHYDKLGFVLYARDMVMGVDPGTQSYGAPTHNTWDKVTVAHNTVVVDGQTQAEATGTLHRFAALPGLAMASADAGEAYTITDLLRTLIVAPDYVLDHFHVRATDEVTHDVDWVYHNFGALTTTLPLTPYAGLPSENGYQHLADPQAAVTDADWQVTFRMDEAPGGAYGSTWANDPTITATFTYDQGEAVGGSGSGKLTYDFSAATGYILYLTESPDAVEEVPESLRLHLYGDGSGHDLTLRVYDSTDERFAKPLGPIDWTGWQTITATGIISWTHYLGNDDGIFDLPARRVAIQLTYEDGGPVSGTLYVDDVVLRYPTAGESLVEDFELERRGMRLWMLGQLSTTVVTGEGLGPNLLEPVPFAMARRTGQTTTFGALLEPIGAAPAITAFAALTSSAVTTDAAVGFLLTTGAFTDHLLAVADGPPAVRRTFGGAACDGVLCLIRRDDGGRLQRLVLADGASLEDAGVVLITSTAHLPGLQVDYSAAGTELELAVNAPLTRPLRIFAPSALTVTMDGTGIRFIRSDDYVLLPLYPLYLPLTLRKASR